MVLLFTVLTANVVVNIREKKEAKHMALERAKLNAWRATALYLNQDKIYA